MRFSPSRLSGVVLAAALMLVQAAPRDARFELIYQTPRNGPGGTPTHLVAMGGRAFCGLAVAQSSTQGSSLFCVSGSRYQTVHTFPPAFTGYSLVRAASGLLFGDGGLVQGADRRYRYFSFDRASGDYREFPAEAGKIPGALISSPEGEVFGLVGTGYQQFTLSRIAPDGRATALHAFTAAEGVPYRGESVALASGGDFYGIASSSASGVATGWLFRVAPDGQYEKLAGIEPFSVSGLSAPILVARSGMVYFAIAKGGVHETGAILKYDGRHDKYDGRHDGRGVRLETVAQFPAKGSMAWPATLIEGTDGLLYGSNNNLPSYLFSLNPRTGLLTETFAFEDAGQQGQCPCKLVEAGDGSFFGAAAAGGKVGTGTIFHFTPRTDRPGAARKPKRA
jgi:hypothetical protein